MASGFQSKKNTKNILFIDHYLLETVHRALFTRNSDRDAKYALSKLLQIGTVAEYESEFVVLANRVTRICESLDTSFYISKLKLRLSIELLRARPTSLGEAFSLACIIEARLEAIVEKEKEKEQTIKKKADTILTLRCELASPEIKGSLDADEDIGIDEVVMGGGEALGVYREKSRGATEGERRVLFYV
ncbi:hypothetical protein Tco_0736026 [Tanacetum coccineum]